ncbi:MAG: hypothetical protein ACRYG5_14875 [Janthinobacterium lividum]
MKSTSIPAYRSVDVHTYAQFRVVVAENQTGTAGALARDGASYCTVREIGEIRFAEPKRSFVQRVRDHLSKAARSCGDAFTGVSYMHGRGPESSMFEPAPETTDWSPPASPSASSRPHRAVTDVGAAAASRAALSEALNIGFEHSLSALRHGARHAGSDTRSYRFVNEYELAYPERSTSNTATEHADEPPSYASAVLEPAAAHSSVHAAATTDASRASIIEASPEQTELLPLLSQVQDPRQR